MSHINIQLFVDSLTASSDILWKTRQKNMINGPTYTFLKTDKHANIKWGVLYYIQRAPKILQYTKSID